MATSLFDLTGKTALVTGGSKGLGKAMARGLAEAGADVVISSRHENELRTALAEILKGTGPQRRTIIVADMSQREDVKRLAQDALELIGRVDILINNAGTNKPQAIDAITDEAWDEVLEINLSSVMALTRRAGAADEGAPLGPHHSHLVDHGVSVEGEAQLYSATKAALLGLARATRLDLGAVRHHRQLHRPGAVPDRPAASVLSEAEKKTFADHTALGRWGNPKELVGPALLLASDAGSYITGPDARRGWGFLGAVRGKRLLLRLIRPFRRQCTSPTRPVRLSDTTCTCIRIGDGRINGAGATTPRARTSSRHDAAVRNRTVEVRGLPMEKSSVYVDGEQEALRFKWIESEKAGCDLGEAAIRRWVQDHWWGYLRARWLEHLQGKRFWVELDRGDFGLLQRKFHDNTLLLDRILDRLKAGQENLDIICWAHDWGIAIDPVLQILEALDINSRRLAHRFDPHTACGSCLILRSLRSGSTCYRTAPPLTRTTCPVT